jgi:hypothetical protein
MCISDYIKIPHGVDFFSESLFAFVRSRFLDSRQQKEDSRQQTADVGLSVYVRSKKTADSKKRQQTAAYTK